MNEQIGNALIFYAFYSTLGIGQAGLTVTADVYKNGASLLSDQAASEVGGGLYKYTLASGSVDTEGEYIVIFKTATISVDQQHLPALWVVQKAGVENLNASVFAVKAKTDNLPDDPADESLLVAAITSAVSTIRGADSDTLKTLSDQLDDVGTLGAGAIAWPITISVSGNPVDGVDVWVTTDEAGSNVIASGETNDNGLVTFMLDVGDYFAWKQSAGFAFTNPESFTVVS